MVLQTWFCYQVQGLWEIILIKASNAESRGASFRCASSLMFRLWQDISSDRLPVQSSSCSSNWPKWILLHQVWKTVRNINSPLCVLNMIMMTGIFISIPLFHHHHNPSLTYVRHTVPLTAISKQT